MADVAVIAPKCRVCAGISMALHQRRGLSKGSCLSTSYVCCDCGAYTTVGPGRKWRYSEQVRRQVRFLRHTKGLTYQKISSKLKIPVSTISDWIKESRDDCKG